MANTSFDYWKERYDKNWATESQIRRLTELGVLTEDEYEQIVGKPF